MLTTSLPTGDGRLTGQSPTVETGLTLMDTTHTIADLFVLSSLCFRGLEAELVD